MLRHRYPIWPLIHLIGTALWIALFIILVCAFIKCICRKRMRILYGQGHCGCHGRGYGHCGGHKRGHGHCGCHGRGHGHCGGHRHDHEGEGGHGHGYEGGGGHGCGCSGPTSHLDALEILRQRYARGEIDDATFQHMREVLGPSPAPERPPEG